MSDKNTIQVKGTLSINPEPIKGKHNQSMVYFSLASIDSNLQNNPLKKVVNQRHNVVALGNIASRIKTYVEKGDEVLITGKMTYGKFLLSDIIKENGVVFVNQISFLKKGVDSKCLA